MLDYHVFGADIPQKHWSMMNQYIAVMEGYFDARCYNDWRKVGRWVKAGEKAFHIVKPIKKTIEDDDGNKVQLLIGYGLQPEFGYEQTDGKPLEYMEELEKKVRVNPDMVKVANAIGVTVKTSIAYHGEGACYVPFTKEIRISSDGDEVIYHELAHAVDYYLHEKDGLGSTNMKEVVAEYSSAVLARHFNPDSKIEISKHYISSWAKKDLIVAMEEAFKRVSDIVNFILTVCENEYRLVS